MSLAPIALFVYNRPEHTKRTIDSLSNNDYAEQSELFVFCDGPKPNTNMDKIREVRSIVKQATGFKKVIVYEKENNVGLAKSIISGVTELVTKHGKIIVLEDDMITSKYFLTYLNHGLEYYENLNQVVSIHAYRLPFTAKTPETYFLRGADCWGWATWKRGWDLFEVDGQKLLDKLISEKLIYQFDMQGSYPYTQMLKDQIAGKNDSWAIRWYASTFLQNKLTLYPARSLVFNIGLDASGTHCEVTNEYDVDLSSIPIRIETIQIEENVYIRNLYRDYFRKLSQSDLRIRIFGRLKQLLERIKTRIWPDKSNLL
ncbi:glycosyltransferase, group 2 domain protein [Leptospira interrogans str. 2003000735]|uniref:Glycosyltransferase, group 2 domain protein n=1 Tax=Leptospira interrogans str. 2002000626 TaxID=996803 RepID=A0A829D9I0_LEPIR|nr:glycosyltransferase [Leptospira interrogans]EMY05041.1 glycosyltransferase, group 2 domain protein [Leptospira interrogans str. 2002000626]EKN90277.1 glycosyltransferase, group 2 domain protein [Leptospira interrogans str. 2002000624]EKO88285.1 glycosyltransferase, group 2 domain protein [Leptospira interrogans serovar Grippotyphosa str. Andaman]EKP83937.1 glycosyltransferase, group 2 domain protein [Leptospira interrogans serovar Grippotyphosa str. 2006006986]EKQ36023.1 glycosyltransferase